MHRDRETYGQLGVCQRIDGLQRNQAVWTGDVAETAFPCLLATVPLIIARLQEQSCCWIKGKCAIFDSRAVLRGSQYWLGRPTER